MCVYVCIICVCWGWGGSVYVCMCVCSTVYMMYVTLCSVTKVY